MKPFLLLATRAEDDVAASEYAAFRRYGGLGPDELVRHRLERDPLGVINLDDYAGILLGGSPFNNTDPQELKSHAQLRAEGELRELASQVVAEDRWFFGACYGIGVLGGLQGGMVDREYGEPVGAVPVTLTDEGVSDPLFSVLPTSFDAFVGHKEAVSRLPGGATLLASSPACPVQAFRLGRRVYATQFHPELDADGLCVRVDAYKAHGYFDPETVETVKAAARAAHVTAPTALLRRFVELATGAPFHV